MFFSNLIIENIQSGQGFESIEEVRFQNMSKFFNKLRNKNFL